MKRYFSMVLAAVLLVMCLFTEAPQASASTKATHSRAISIVFDNSGSMYTERSMAWCRATYAMEVFASMLNPGDTLQIHPMHPISVDGQKYTMDVPYRITDAQQASKIRDIFTPAAFGTPIESIDSAAQQLKTLQADKKYLVMQVNNKQQFKKCSPIHRQLIYEGMAKWAEIQYLYLIGETNVARREEIITRNREDAYGLGFCLYEERYPLTREAMSCQETPFTPDQYPLA